MKYRKKIEFVEAHQWFKNGDHPDDHDHIGPGPFTAVILEKYYEYTQTDGKVVRRYTKEKSGSLCSQCGAREDAHGWLQTWNYGHMVCPGDYIITTALGQRYPISQKLFEETYEAVDDE